MSTDDERADARSRTLLSRAVGLLGRVFVVGLVAASAVVAWLYLTAPEPSAAGGWDLEAPLPDPRGELATAVAHAAPCPMPPCPNVERLFVVGGLAGLGRAQDRVESYDPTLGLWSVGPPLPGPRHHLGAAGLGQALYVSGGAAEALGGWTPTQDFWRLGVDGDEWERLEPMPEGRWGHRMVAHDDRLWVVGGHGPTSQVLIYTPGEGWERGAEMPVPRHHLSVVVVDGRIWAMGGRIPESLARVDIYDPEAGEWRPGPALPASTSGAAEGVVDGVVLVYGGEEARLLGGGVYDRHWMLDTRRGPREPGVEVDPETETEPQPGMEATWTTDDWAPAPPPPLAVHGADGAVFQGRMVIVGGAGRHGMLSVTSWTDAFQRLEEDILQVQVPGGS